MDPAFAPGTGTPQVDGLSDVQILDMDRALKGLNLCDLVEVSSQFDCVEITSRSGNLFFEQLCLFCFC